MNKLNCLKVLLSFTVVLLLVFGANNIVLGYGDGGGGGGGGGAGGDGGGADTASGGTASTQITGLTDEEIAEVFSPLDAETRQTLTTTFSGSNITIRDLMTIRQTFLTQSSQNAQTEASIMNGLTVTVEGLDWLGQQSQTIISFLPGVGLVTSVTLDATRAGANAYQGGKSTTEILRDTTIAAVSSVTISKLTPFDTDKTFATARAGWNILIRGTGQHTGKAVRVVVRNGVKYLVQKEAEALAGSALTTALDSSTKQAPHRETPPIHTLPGVTYDTTPTGIRVYK